MAADDIRQAIELAKAGRKSEARQIATRILRRDADNATAWVVMAQVVTNRQQAIDCLKNVLRLEPGHPWATLHLGRLERLEEESQVAPPPPTLPPAPEPEPAPPPVTPRPSTTPGLSLDDFSDIVRPAETVRAEDDLDPFFGTAKWERPPSAADTPLGDIRAELGESAGPKRRKRGPWAMLIILFLVLALIAVLAAAYVMGQLPLPF